MRTVVHGAALLLLCACTTPHKKAASGTSPAVINEASGIDTARAYEHAIADYIKAMRERDGGLPDTLYIGRHAEFPEIQLPAIIEHTTILIVTPGDAGAVKDGERFAYLNIFAWFTPGHVEFVVVNFTQDMRHRPDAADDRSLYYTIGPGQKEFALDSLKS